MIIVKFFFKAIWSAFTTLAWLFSFWILASFTDTWWVMPTFWLLLIGVTILAIVTRTYIWAVPIWGDIERHRNKGAFPGALIRNADKEHRKILQSVRKIWEPMTYQIGLTKGDDENRRYPRVDAIRSEPRGPILIVRPATGSSVDEWVNKTSALTTAFALNAIVKASKTAGSVELQLETADPLADTREAQLPEGWMQS